jgi:hypothetical protein
MARPDNVPSSIGVPGGAPNDVRSIAAYLTQLVTGLNNWVSRAANAINYSLIQTAPQHSTSRGEAGQLAYDGSYLYVCVSTNTWARVAVGGSW